MKIREIRCPMTPVDLFHRLSRRPGCFFLDSAQAGGDLGRFSFLGCEPDLVFEAAGLSVKITTRGRTETTTTEPFAALQELLARRGGPAHPRLPFVAGAVGGISYEAGSSLEGVAATRTGGPDLPDLHFGFYQGCFAFDHATGQAYLTAHAVEGGSDDAILARLERTLGEALSAPPAPAAALASNPEPVANWKKPGYLAAVQRIKEYIAAGDVYQVNLTQRFDTVPGLPAPELYLKLRTLSPAPFACYYDGGRWQALGCSPERFLQLRHNRIETRPIKGTRPRGATADEDARLRAELLGSAKDRAELLMIVDLERNDLGRICEFGSVQVQEACALETHPTVFHLVGTVSGRPRPDLTLFDCLRATLPGGSITGAPKIRAMQVIRELEPVPRGFYTGAFGYLGGDGGCDLNVAIRTIICADGRASYHVGGGIVWDSDPEAEYQEAMAKGRALRAALMA